MAMVPVWTRQHPQVLRTLEAGGIYRVEEAHIRAKNDTISDYYLELYRWYTRRGSEFVPAPEGVSYPIWVSLSTQAMLQPVEDTVVLALEVPREQLLITDMNKWGYRVNYWYIPTDPADEERHLDELQRLGIANQTALTLGDKGNFYPLLKRKIVQSWDRLFTSPPASPTDGQGTLWEIRPEWLKEVIAYG